MRTEFRASRERRSVLNFEERGSLARLKLLPNFLVDNSVLPLSSALPEIAIPAYSSKFAGTTMRAFIEHRGQHNLFGRRPRFVLHLHFTFSDEERAIIATRALDNYVFDLSPGYLASTERRHTKEALTGMKAVAVFAFLISFPLLFLAAAFPLFVVPTLLCLFGSPVAFWWATLARHREDSAYTSKLSLRDLVASPTIAVQADNPGLAPTLDENMRARALSLKHFLTKTHDLASPRMFEL